MPLPIFGKPLFINIVAYHQCVPYHDRSINVTSYIRMSEIHISKHVLGRGKAGTVDYYI